MRKLIILGGGGNALDTLDVVEAINRASLTWDVVGLLDDRREAGSEYLGLRVLGPLASASSFEGCFFTSSIWNDRVFRRLHDILAITRLPASSFATLVHPGSSVSSRAKLGHGVIVNFGASIAGEVEVQDFVSIGPGCIVGHGSVLQSYTALAAAAVLSGSTRVGRNCYIGSGAMIRQNISIADGALVGMGAVVVRDVEPDLVVAGSPARPLKPRLPVVQ